jgi:predicted amidohydrolase
MNKNIIKIALAQMLVEGGEVSANLGRAKQMIKKAAALGCNFVVLPECLDIGWAHPKAQELAQAIPGSYSNEICEEARRNQIFVVAGLTERFNDRLYNTAILISQEGAILTKHRKINILTDVEGIYSVGDSLSVVETPFGTIAINICADNSPNSLALGHSLARMGARLILSPCAWAVESDHDNAKAPYGDMWKDSYSTLARLYDMPVIGVSNVGWVTGGPWSGWKCIGCSLAVGSDGEVLTQLPYGESAEKLELVQMELKHSTTRGTSIGQMLSSKGYVGP